MSSKKKQNRRSRQPNSNPPLVASNDRISKLLQSEDLVPDPSQGSDKFFDLITWNIKFFNNRDPKRVAIITNILHELNADIFVFQEIEEHSLDVVAQNLIDSSAGLYKVAYGTTGGDQRVAIMYDTEWVKASEDIKELFGNEDLTVNVENLKKQVFPRLPLASNFVVRTADDPFDFNLVGVHLKSQRGGGFEQRKAAAQRLAEYIQNDAADEDIIIAGDWNADPNRPEWEPIQDLEKQGLLKFEGFNFVNSQVEGSHLSVGGRRSKLDVVAVTIDAAKAVVKEADVVEWTILDDSPLALTEREVRKKVIDTISDHLPVLTRFNFTDRDADDEA
ncbi:hypothetical protein F7734_25460 [Scytonema sp. UIC 10036]|uniref:endonuclease/exonuclease/phosphatase family protein n=1 Tax=Scytonema sp. UIC 10036 TaxID=2304196 RepID=UPI0012DA80F8|nr:endonuclease/exonuclease/phosphatase family protein [Scytonema sp. UIC 10036]MUG95527.1 hypothetical protein [Scytonema sp. UIC 10036]